MISMETAMIRTSEQSTTGTLPLDRQTSALKRMSRKTLLFFVGASSLFFIITIILTTLYAIGRNTTRYDQTMGNLCTTRYCIKAANNILESIDENIDPCENFYHFACGSWIRNTAKESEMNEQDALNKIEIQIKRDIADLLSALSQNKTIESKAITNVYRLYMACMNEKAIETDDVHILLKLINEEFGGWPILQGSSWNNSRFNFSQLWSKLGQYNNFIFYHVETKIDKKHINMHRIRISPSQLNLGYYGFYTNNSVLALTYQQFIREFVLELSNKSSMIDTDINDMFKFEKNIAKYHEILDDHSLARTLRTTMKNLSKIININFDLATHLRWLYGLANITLMDDDIVTVKEIDAIRNISLLITQQSPRTLQNYMIWRFIIHRILHMPKRFRTILERLRIATFGKNNIPIQKMTCIDYVNDNMGFAVSKLYLNRYYDRLARHESIKIVNNIRNTFIDMINQSLWMDDESKQKTIEKAQTMLTKIGYPDFLDDENGTKLENIYADYHFNSSHMQNILLLLQLNAKENFRRLNQSVNRLEWIDYTPITSNAFYHPLLNKIVVPAGILRSPYFHIDAPKYLNYGAIGSIVGHEITHGFDELRRHIDKHGKKITSWSDETINVFNRRSNCIVEQYDNYTVTQVNLKVNGKRTREENIADNDGLKKAFEAYRKWTYLEKTIEKRLPGLTKYSPEQMFFISFGQLWCSKMTGKSLEDLIYTDNHAPSEFRINGPTSNLFEFDQAFSCQPGQGNSRVNKCVIW